MFTSNTLHQAPLFVWLRQKQNRTLQDIANAATAKGLVLTAPVAVNSETYGLTYKGQTVKEGELNVIVWFIDNFDSATPFIRMPGK